MRGFSFARLSVALLLFVGLTLTMAPQITRPTVASANVQTTSTVCGSVQGYIAPTLYSNGVLDLGGISYSIAAGTVLTNAFLITSGANLCVNAFFDASGEITAGTVTVGSGAPLSICGAVTGYIPATFVTPGTIVIGGTIYSIAPGTTLTGSSLIGISPNVAVCLTGTLNSFGQIVSGTINASGVGTVRLCGFVQNYIPATLVTPGLITIGSRSLAIASGTVIVAGNAIGLGNDICLIATVNSNQQIVGGSVTADVSLSLVVCGAVTAFVPPTNAVPGFVTINGASYVIAAGTALSGTVLIGTGATLCFNGILGGPGQIIGGTFTQPAGTPTPISICGVVTGYVAPTTTLAGSVGIAGTPYPIAVGVSLTGASLLVTGTNVCLQGTLDASGELTGGTVTFNGGVEVTVCGLISGYFAASSTMAGSLTIAGISFPIAAGTTITGGTVAAPATLGITVVLNGQGAVSGGNITANTCAGSSVSGPVASYVPPTATTAGSITIGSVTYPVAAGTVLTINSGVPLAATPLHAPAPGLRGGGPIPE